MNINDLAHEIWAAAQLVPEEGIEDGAHRIAQILAPKWNDDGEATNLTSAAEDADEWLALIERLHNDGRGPWKFSDATSLERLRGCRRALRRFLTPNC